MGNYDYDLFVIGGGSAGVRAARVAAAAGARVALAEPGRLGGTCVNAGCIPKKLLTYASGFAEGFKDAAGFGFAAARPDFAWSRLVAGVDAEVRRLNEVYARMLRDAGVALHVARAAFAGPHRIAVGDRIVTARHALIATGGRPARPDLPGLDLAFTSDQAFHLPALPRRLLVLGGGYVAAEFAGIFAGLGVATVLAHRGPRLLAGFDAELTGELAEAMRRSGIELLLGATLARLERGGTGLVANFAGGAATSCDAVLVATGRRPNTEGLGLETVGIAPGPHGAITVDDAYRADADWIYAVGDVIDRLRLTPVALAEANAVAAALFAGRRVALDYALVPSAVFSRPELAGVGLTEDAARARGGEVDVYRARFRPLKHRLTGREESSLVKLVVERASDRVLGAHMLGEGAAEIVQGLAVALAAGATKAHFDATLGIHPTSAEEFVTLRRRAED